jgi:hypothetical protein
VVELVAENLMVMTVVAGMVERRERVKIEGRKGKILGRKAGFRPTLDPISPLSGHEMHPYL